MSLDKRNRGIPIHNTMELIHVIELARYHQGILNIYFLVSDYSQN